MDIRSVLCQGTNMNGAPCTRHPRHGEDTCPHHDPDRVEERARKLEEQAALVRRTAPVAEAAS